MTQELKERWLTALRSGKYEQGKGYLRKRVEFPYGKHDLFCALGVLCDVANPDGWGEEVYGSLNWEGGTLGALVPVRTQSRLVTKNDTNGLTFAEIADWIETAEPDEWEEPA